MWPVLGLASSPTPGQARLSVSLRLSAAQRGAGPGQHGNLDVVNVFYYRPHPPTPATWTDPGRHGHTLRQIQDPGPPNLSQLRGRDLHTLRRIQCSQQGRSAGFGAANKAVRWIQGSQQEHTLCRMQQGRQHHTSATPVATAE